jgi:predicted Zn-dependent protease
MPPVEPAATPDLDLWNDSTRNASPADRAEAVQRIVAVADREGLTAAGAISTSAIAVAVGNSAGQFVHQTETLAALACSATGPDSVGWAQGASRDFESLDVDRIVARAVEKARSGRNPREAPPGRYEVILEPAAVDTFLTFFFHYQMDARATDEGRTFLTGKKGQALVSPRVHLYSDPACPDCPARPFTAEGLPLRVTDWIRDGVLSNLVYSRYWAKEKSVEPTGTPTNLILGGGDSSVEDLIRSTHRGLLVTRFWYVRAVEPVRDLFTGMTRDGTFLIENGEIAGAVRNLRFNESPVHFLSEVEALGPREIVSERGSWRLMPYVKSRDFHFTSTTRF